MEQIKLDFVFRHLRLGQDEECKPLFQTPNGLYFKRRPETDKAKQEYLATRLARLLLPAMLRLPTTWGVIEDRFITERIDSEDFDSNSEKHAVEGAKYLARLHAIQLSPSLVKELQRCGYNHYEGQTLSNRLKEELQKAKEAFGDHTSMASTLESFDSVIREATEKWNFNAELVLGHGDYQAQNIKVNNGEIIPLDWTDFGLCYRGYDIAHYLTSLNSDLRQTAVENYVSICQCDLATSLSQGEIVDRIIRAGSDARKVVDLGEPIDDVQESFKKNVSIADQKLQEVS